ncbi:zinc finger matrin-type protein 5 isoform X1 [Danio aesculapii]|uniref:zinc finger matrin-type protein 5 isoform X1 n=1 Tax=Danio aesculapii TaxID=1142201 RepID=UPI0024BF5945|nr:zinc finger matrin-type protein 5 isoform X1 [Danio aesculapii]
MGKRYYCDYCDRSFQDNLHNRKKHLNGVQHHRAKKAWFDNFRDAATLLNDERAKEVCRKFLQTGQCVFGTSCRFSHMSEKQMKMLEQKIDDEKRQKEDPDQDGSSERSVDEWLSRREKKLAALTSGRSSSISTSSTCWWLESDEAQRMGLKWNLNSFYLMIFPPDHAADCNIYKGFFKSKTMYVFLSEKNCVQNIIV